MKERVIINFLCFSMIEVNIYMKVIVEHVGKRKAIYMTVYERLT
jgi:hypothetical protein